MDHLRIEEFVEFSQAKRVRKKLTASEKIVTELLCYEPGQSSPMHHHPGQDEVFYVLDGTGTISIGAEEQTVNLGSLIFVPAQTRHAIRAADNSRLVILFFKSPASVSAQAPV
jgi:quercetin dioxygenase-like cupin family protein